MSPTLRREHRGAAARALVAGVVTVAAVAACASSPAEPTPSTTSTAAQPSASPPTPASPQASASSATATPGVSVLASGLKAPWSIAFDGNTPLISERDTARILEVGASGALREVGTIGGVAPEGEAGLLGIAVRERMLYAYFTADDDNRIQRFTLRGSAGSLSLGSPETVLDGIPKANFHDGGRLAFGPDGMLYATTGDAGTPSRSQDRRDLGGKILRLTPDGKAPADNPFRGSLIYSYGHRNPQGIAWGSDGTMYAAEFGQNTWDELNVIQPGKNYGWPTVEGKAGRSRFVDPVQQWPTDDASPSGIAVTDDSVVIANLRGRSIRRVPLASLGTSTTPVTDYGRIRDVVRTPGGELWALTNNTDGRGDPGPDDDRLLRVTLP